ncbi:single-stranded DNA-binding protein [Liquorilactobacillus sucicola DSM 21376 = JCM 15457]|uniref:Single-stranded DNA-binding protein n=1 Tax=Liquorilactobacillus sucicola DSM 21376 = JCM 15457 TaxID=1423806 RepID=A0A023CYN4_9LACO|nr:single-stranded DNA-binding protein [Liquorilactobacillus sucicola]KRN06732.1 single-strand dna binding protein [Liquorilactobacillus sucicola DSM 21376 = JCM 15457]GAJ27002.1 single-stranded DNA-binding protein [Liquorilactobacillus sucicola DSM 21376 = JCM 15457]
MINRAVLVGRLTRDPDLRYTANGVAVATFTVAVNRQFTNQQGEREADFINCVIWRKAAENFANFTHKGSLVGVDGRIQTRSYENQQGVRVYVTEIVVDSFSLLESRSQSERYQQQHGGNDSQGSASSQNGSNPNNDNLFGNSTKNNSAKAQDNNTDVDPFADNGKQIDISDDDLPF